MKEEQDGPMPGRRRPPDSIWERYLTGKLSLEDKETLPGLVKELHREIANHLAHRADPEQREVERPSIDSPAAQTPAPVIDIITRRTQTPKRRRIDPRQN